MTWPQKTSLFGLFLDPHEASLSQHAVTAAETTVLSLI